jgi:site-specific recombinase XerD
MGLFCRHLVKKGLLLVDPSRDLKVRRPDSSVGFVPGPEAVKRLLHLARPESALARERLIEPPRGRKERELFERRRLRVVAEALRERAILEVLYGSGLRFAELRALDVSDLHLAERTLFIRSGKGRKDRVVPLTRSSVKALVTYLSEGRPVLLSKKTAKAPWRGRAEPRALFLTVAATRLYDAWRPLYLAPLARAAGLPKGFGPHRLRHACAVHLLEDGADVVAISRLLGHASLAATAIYLRLTEAALHKAILAAHPRERSRE